MTQHKLAYCRRVSWLVSAGMLLSVFASSLSRGQSNGNRVPFEETNVVYADRFGCKADYNLGAGTGTDNSASFVAMFQAAAAKVAAFPGQRVLVVISPGHYRIGTRITCPRGVNLDMRGARIVYTGSDYDGAILTIGESSGNDEGGVYLGLAARAANTDHLFPAGKPYFAAVRLRNIVKAHVEMGWCEHTNVGLQLFPDPALACTLNAIHGGRFTSQKIGIDIRGNASDGYSTENAFYKPDISPTSSMFPFGSFVGVQFSTESLGYTGQDNNIIHAPCFQMAGWDSTYAWSSGKTGLTTGNRYRASNGWEYEKTAGGTTGGTDEPTSTTVGGTFVDNAGVTWTTRGIAMRIPIYHNGAGTQGKVEAARWETGYGPFAFDATGTFAEDFEYEVAHDGGHTEWGLASSAGRDVDSWSRASTIHALKLNTRISGPRDAPPPSFEINNFHHRYIGSGSNYTIQGMSFMTAGAYDNHTVHGGSNANNILCRDSLYLDSGSVRPIIFIDCQRWKRFKITPDAPIFTGISIDCLGYKNSWEQLEFDATTKDVFGGFGTQFFGASDWLLTNSAQDQNPRTYAVSEDSDARYLGFPLRSSVKWRGWRLDALRDTIGVGYDLIITTPFGPLDRSGRYAYGTPDEGFFRIAGERIANVNTTAAQPHFWTVITAGALAPAWAGNVAVIEGELRKNASNIYYAVAAGTTGNPGTAPTHTSGTVTDGGVLWAHLCAEALLEASTDTY
jgi:hypothetical protein